MAIATAPARSEQNSDDLPQNLLMSFAEYIEHERASDVKHHFFHGELIEAAGASLEHNIICGNSIRVIGNALDDSDCIVMPSDMQVFVSPNAAYYPDLVVVCDAAMVTFEETLQNPVLIAEVLSPSTAAFDRGDKFRQYRTITSLRHYLLLEQDRPTIEHFERDAAGVWTLRGEYDALEQNIELTISDHKIFLPLSKIYRNITFPAVAPSAVPPETTEE